MFKSALIRTLYLGVMFLANLLLANLLLPYYYGTLTMMILNASMLSIFTGLGTDSIILYSLVNKKWTTGQALSFTRNAIIVQIFLFLFCEAITIGFYDRTLLSQNNISYLIPESAFFLGLIISEKLLILFYSQQKAFIANSLAAISAIFFFSILVYLKYYPPIDTSWIIIIFSLQSLFQGLLLLLVYHYTNKEPFSKLSTKRVIETFKLSIIVMITNVIQFFAYRVDYYFLDNLFSEYQVGIFAQSNKMANLMWIVPNIFALLIIPRLSLLTDNQHQNIFKLAFLSNFVLLFITLMAGSIAFIYILQPQYASGLNAFYLMIPGYFCWATVIYFGSYFSYSGKFHYNLIASSFCFIAIIISDALLIPRYGINGAAISNSIVYSATLILYLFIYLKKSQINFTSFLRFRLIDFRLLLNALK